MKEKVNLAEEPAPVTGSSSSSQHTIDPKYYYLRGTATFMLLYPTNGVKMLFSTSRGRVNHRLFCCVKAGQSVVLSPHLIIIAVGCDVINQGGKENIVLMFPQVPDWGSITERQWRKHNIYKL